MAECNLKRKLSNESNSKRLKTNETLHTNIQQDPTYNPAQPSLNPPKHRTLSAIVFNQNELKNEVSKQGSTEDTYTALIQYALNSLNFREKPLPVNVLSEKICKKHAEQLRKKETLIKEIEECRRAIEEKTSSLERAKRDSHDKCAKLKTELAQLSNETELEKAKLIQEISHYEKIRDIARVFTCTEIQNENNKYKVTVNHNGNTFSFILTPEQGNTYDYEPLSYSLCPEQVPEYLRSEINLDKSHAPLLFRKIMQCLSDCVSS